MRDYFEGKPESQGEKESEERQKFLCTQAGTSYVCDRCIKDLKKLWPI